MDVRQVVKRSDTIVGLVRDLRKLFSTLGRIAKLNREGRVKTHYLASHKIRKLQLGSGPTSLDGWLCTDLAPTSDRAVYLDATKPFPFDNGTFNYVFSEHLIEHISCHEGSLMLQECRRVLKPGGTIRIATPDLEVLIGLFSRNGDPLNERYIKWVTNKYLDGLNVYKAAFVINNAFHNWGHQFLYDDELLEMAMEKAGFTNIRRCLPGESDDVNLRGIESHGKNVDDDEMAAFETMVLEGSCPE